MTHRSSIYSIRQFTHLFCRKAFRSGGTAGALVLLFLLFTGGTAQAQSCTTTVTTAADSGAGSLRDALGGTAVDGMNVMQRDPTERDGIVAPPDGSARQHVATGQAPDGLSAAEWHAIQQQIAVGSYRAHAGETGTGYRAANDAHGLRIAYGTDGTVTLTPYDTVTDAWQVSLRLFSVGYGVQAERAQMAPATAPALQTAMLATGSQVTYTWSDTLREWWVNDVGGLEQWFQVDQAPPGRSPGQWLRVTMTLASDLTPRLAAGRLLLEKGNTRLTYDNLHVWDASGRTLPAHIELTDNHLTLAVDDATAVYPITIDPTWAQQAYLKASNTGADDSFGLAVAIDGDTLVVGAPFEDSNSTGVYSSTTWSTPGANNSASNAGAVYVFVRSGATWSQQAYLKASNTGANDNFGNSVAIDGDTLVVGARGEASNATGVNGDGANNSATGAGAAYVFVRSGTTWSQQAYLKASNTASNDRFGFKVAIDGNTLVVAARDEDSNATGVNGSQSDNSAADAGAAYVFVRSGTTWSQQAYLKASNTGSYDNFGISVAIAGDTLAVGAYFEASNATGVNGNGADNSAPGAGAAYVFVRSGTTWSQQAYVKASNTGTNDLFGISVAIAGDTLAVGAYGESSSATGVNGNEADDSAPGAGAAYVFVRSGTTWSQQAYLKASNTGGDDNFGYSVAITGDLLAVGAQNEASNATGVNGSQSDDSASGAGAAYVFARSGTTWSQQAYLKASNTGASDLFGTSMAIDSDTLVVGAYDEDSNATGVDGNQSNNSALGAGAAYAFNVFTPLPAGCNAMVVSTGDSGAGTLRQALRDVSSGSTICFDTDTTFSTPQTITLASGLSITQSLTISGTGIDDLVLNGNNAYRVISVTAGVDVTLKNLTVRNGMVSNNTGAGIYSRGALTLTNVAVFSNTAGTNAAALGGGLYVSGTLTMEGGRVERNRAARGGGMYVNAGTATLTGVGVYSNTAVNADGGGGLYSKGVLTVTDSAVFSNTCTVAGCFGGGVAIYGGAALLSGGRIVTNTAGGSGGGLYVYTGTVTITGLELNSNTASSLGGGVYTVGGALTILTSTVGSNSSGAGGGGLAAMTAGSLVMTNTAVYGNRTGSNGGGIYNDGRPVTLYASQVYSNTSAGNSGGGGIYSNGPTGVLRIYAGSMITGNQAVGNGNGGGIYLSSSTLAVVDSSVGENSASASGGIHAVSSIAVTLERATIYANTAITYYAGGLSSNGGALTVTTSTIATNTAKTSGGGVYLSGSALKATLIGSSIYSNTAMDSGAGLGGGGLSLNSGAYTLTNMTIANNLASGSNSQGGGINVSGGVLWLDGDSRIYGNRANATGGGVYLGNSAIVTMTGGAVYGNSTSALSNLYGGGGLRVEGAAPRLLLTGTQVYSNSTASSGGGLSVVAGAVTLINSAVTTNTATGSSTHGGGGIRINSGALTLTATSLAGNAVTNSNAAGGGSLYVVNGTVMVSAGEVTSNTAPMGGGIYLAAGTLTVDGTPVQRNRASGVYGGGLYAHTGTQTTLTNTAFYSNSALLSGGGIAGYGVLTATGITLAANRAGSDGGGAYLMNGSTTLRGAQVFSNTAAAQGGGVKLSAATLMLTDAAIYSNTATQNGGGMNMIDSTATAITVTVTDNVSGASGGAISLNGTIGVSGLRLTGVTIAGNVSGSSGGGIAISSNAWLTATRTSIAANRTGVSQYGGGIYLSGTNAWMNIDASSIYSNTSTDGGGIYASNPFTLTNSTVAHNKASANGGGIYKYGDQVQMRNVTLAGNTAATQGGGLYLPFAATANLTNTLIVNSTTGGSAGGDIVGQGTLNQAQVLTGTLALGALQDNGGATWTMALPAGSPAIDAGADCPPPATDQRGVARPQGSACDIGAYEAPPQVALTVTRAGTGSGTVASTPAGIDCGAACTANFEVDTAVTLAATPVNARFDGWSGACSGSGACTVTMTETKRVTATFTVCPVGVAYVNGAAGGANTGASWPDAYPDLQDALRTYDACGTFSEIWVARGIYTPGITYSDTFTIPAGVAVYGGFAATETVRTQRDWAANVTVLSGDLGGDDGVDADGIVTDTATITGTNAYQVALMLSITSTAPITGATRLDGFTITAGNATGPGYNRYGGGLFCHAYAAGSQCSPTLANVTFSGNQGSVGAGMAAFAEGGVSSPLLSGVTFRHNKAVIKSMGGGFAVLGMYTAASPVLTDVTFYSNTAAIGGAMLVVAVSNSVSSPVLNNVTFDANAGAVGGAMANVGYSTGVAQATLEDVLFSGNRGYIDSAFRAALNRNKYGDSITAAFGGALANVGYFGGTAGLAMTGATLQDNRTDAGGAFINAGAGGVADATVQHTRVLSNHALLDGGGVVNMGFGANANLALSNVLLRDNIAAGSGGALVASGNLIDSVAVTVTNATFYSNTAGVGGAIQLEGAGSAWEQPVSLHLANSILWGNRAITSSAQISLTKQATMTIDSSLVEGGWNGAGVGVTNAFLVDGGGNVAGDPLLADSGSDLTLLPGSPALDAGNNSFVDTLVDLMGKLRIFNVLVDMGAYEAQGFALAIAGGDAQSILISNTFPTALQITVTDSGGQPIGAGGVLTFTPPASGAGLSSAAPFTATTNASGVATATVTANSVAGSYPVTVTARGVVTPVAFMLTNLGVPVTVTVASEGNPSVYGQAVTFTATVTNPLAAATPAGTVVFTVASQVAATRTLDASGVATWTTPSLTVGDHAVVADYGGDNSFDPGLSAPITQTVSRAATGVALTSTPNPSVFGQAVIFTATVTVTAPGAGAPTGVITFTDGATLLGAGVLDAGVVTFATSSLIAGLPGDTPAPHSITAAYGGDGNFTNATSTPLDQLVQKATTTATLSSDINPAVFGQPVSFTATVTVTAPGNAAIVGEQVTFQEGAATLGAGVLDAAGVATFTTSSLSTGVHTVTAHYAGTPNITGTVSLAMVQVVAKAGTALTVVAAPNPSVHGQPVTITATLAISAPGAGAPTGVITFTGDGAAITGCNPVALANLQAVCTTDALATGLLTITAAYGGDDSFGASAGVLAGGQAVEPAATAALVTSAPNPSVFKQAAVFTATVGATAPGAGIPTGVVTFTAGATSMGTVALGATGMATLTNSNLVVGDHAITVQYGGDGDFLPATTAVYTHTVLKASTATALAMTPNPALYGDSVYYTATVSPASVTALAPVPSGPTGSVRFTDTTGTVDLTGTVSSGVATAIGGVLPAGHYTVTATYLGDSAYAGSPSAPAMLVVAQYTATITLGSSANPSFVGDALSFTAEVSDRSDAGLHDAGGFDGPTGSVTIADSSRVISLTGALVNGSVTLDAPWLPAGAYTLTAAYSGDAKYAAGESDAFIQVVNRHGTGTALVVAPITAFVSDTIYVTATVTISDPTVTVNGGITGTVTFKVNDAEFGSAEVIDGQVHASVPATATGVITITASYLGNATYAGSDAGAIQVTVARRGSVTALTSAPNPAVMGDEVVLTAIVAELLPDVQAVVVTPSFTPTGQVIFAAQGVELGRGTLIQGTAHFTTAFLTAGDHAIIAAYLGDGAFLPGSSAAYTQTVLPTPLAVNDAAGTRQGDAVMLDPLANDHDPAGGGLTITEVMQPAHGSAAIDSGAKTATYTPAPDFFGLDAFAYTIRDTNGVTATASVAVVVSAKADSNAAQVAPINNTQPTTVTFSSSDGPITVLVPPGAYNGSAGPLGPTDIFYLVFTELVTPTAHVVTPPGGLRFAGKNYTMEVFFNQTRLEHYQFPQPLTFMVTYAPGDGIADVAPETLLLFFWDEAAQQWSQDGLEAIDHDLLNHTITYLVSHFTEFALFGSAAPTALDPNEEPALHSLLYLPSVVR